MTSINVSLELFIYSLTVLSVSSWMMWWFTTSFPIHVLEVLRFLGFKKHDANYWIIEAVPGFPGTDLSRWTRVDFEDWSHKRNHYMAELFTCPGCMSMHISFWVSLTVLISSSLLLGDLMWRIFVFYLTWMSAPSISRIVLNLIKNYK